MHIKFERSGGFTGRPLTTSFDTDDLPESTANDLRALVQKVDFSKLANNLQSNNNAPDQFAYTITVQSQDSQHTVVTNDSSAPEELKPLIDFLNQLARSQRSKS